MSIVTPEVARLVAEPLSLQWTAADATRALRGDDRPFALSGAWAGGAVIAGSEPMRVARPDEDPFALLDDLPEVEGLADAPVGAVGGGWFGHLGFALGHLVERLPPPPPARDALPPFALAFYDHVLRRDADGRWWFEALVTPGREEAIARRRAQLAGRVPVARPFRAGPFTPAPPGTAGLRAAVAECVERIAAGELFQANLTCASRARSRATRSTRSPQASQCSRSTARSSPGRGARRSGSRPSCSCGAAGATCSRGPSRARGRARVGPATRPPATRSSPRRRTTPRT